MTDCTKYGFGHKINLCLRGAAGNGNKANLDIQIDNTLSYRDNLNSSVIVTVPDWDGKEAVVNLTPILVAHEPFSPEATDCDVEVKLTITPHSATTGQMLLEYIFSNCTDTSAYPDVYANCGGAGPHTVSEMSTFSFDGAACT